MQPNPLLRTVRRDLRRWRGVLIGGGGALVGLALAATVAVVVLVSPMSGIDTTPVKAASTVPRETGGPATSTSTPSPSPSPSATPSQSPVPTTQTLTKTCQTTCTVTFEASADSGLQLSVTSTGTLDDYKVGQTTDTYSTITVTGTGTFEASAQGIGDLKLAEKN